MNKKNSTKKTSRKSVAATHLDQIKLKLDELKPNITTSDRRAAQQFFGISKASISKYLNGQVMTAETGLDLLDFFHNRVTERHERLQKFIA
jgi:hypothetical protein